jgi:GAF domain-containing protein
VTAPERNEVTEVAEMFAEIARSLVADDVASTLHRIVTLAVEHLDHCEYAGITVVEGGKITSPASSNGIPRIIDAIQAEVGEGPCVDAVREHAVFQTGHLAEEQRWPAFANRASKTGVQSILSVRLFRDETTFGSLNLYSTAPDAFDDTDVALGSVFAAHAGVALASARHEHDLERKAATRDIIGQAKGILRARSGVSDEEAFQQLRRASQRLNVKLVDVAEQVAHESTPADT